MRLSLFVFLSVLASGAWAEEPIPPIGWPLASWSVERLAVHCDWISAELRGRDGSLKGCLAKVEALNAYRFERADFLLIAAAYNFDGRGPELEKVDDPMEIVALLESVAAPGFMQIGSSRMLGAEIMIGVAQPDGGGQWSPTIGQFDVGKEGRYTLRLTVFDWVLEEMRRGVQLQVSHLDREEPLAYSLRGSSDAIGRFESCSDTLRGRLVP